MKEELQEIEIRLIKVRTIAFKAFEEFVIGDTDQGIKTVEDYKVAEKELTDFIAELKK